MHHCQVWLHLVEQFQIKHMVAFIEQEANEKAEEIDAKVLSYYFTFLANLAFSIIWSLLYVVHCC
jgi:hypothetical protein